MNCYVTITFYGGDVSALAEAARAYNAELIAVNGVAYKDIPFDQRGFREGNASYVFRLQRLTPLDAFLDVETQIYSKSVELWMAKEEGQPVHIYRQQVLDDVYEHIFQLQKRLETLSSHMHDSHNGQSYEERDEPESHPVKLEELEQVTQAVASLEAAVTEAEQAYEHLMNLLYQL